MGLNAIYDFNPCDHSHLASRPWDEDRIGYSAAAQGHARTRGLHALYLSLRGTDESQVTGQKAIPQHPKACSEDVPTHSSLPDGLAAQDSQLGFWPSAQVDLVAVL